MKTFGLLGYPLQHSFSRAYFETKFAKEGLKGYRFEVYETRDIEAFIESVALRGDLAGFSVTIPYKKSILSYLDFLDPVAREVGAVNSVRVRASGNRIRLEGFNTDVYGFTESLRPQLSGRKIRALILGSGGASAAVQYSLRILGIPFRLVSRTKQPGRITYGELTPDILGEYRLIVNTTPLGMYPFTDAAPKIPYSGIEPGHLLFDLIYHPAITRFLAAGKTRGAAILNGKDMLELQAERSWQLWTSLRETDDPDS